MGYPNSAQVDAAVSATGSPAPDVALMNALLRDFYEYLGTRAVAVYKPTSFTFAVADTHPIKIICSDSSSTVTATVPTNASVAIAVSTVIQLCRWGPGEFVIAPASGVTLHSEGSFSLRAQYSTAFLWQPAANVWLLSGGLT